MNKIQRIGIAVASSIALALGSITFTATPIAQAAPPGDGFYMGIGANIDGSLPREEDGADLGQIVVGMGATSLRVAIYWGDQRGAAAVAEVYRPAIEAGAKVTLLLAYSNPDHVTGGAFPNTTGERQAFLDYATDAVHAIQAIKPDALSGIEIWNEWDNYFGWTPPYNDPPNDHLGWGSPCPDNVDPADAPGCPVTYAKLVRTLVDPAWEGITKPSLRTVAPGVPIIGNATSYLSLDWVTAEMQYLHDNNVVIDGAVTHPYAGNDPHGTGPQLSVDSIIQVHDRITQVYGKALPMWITEVGFSRNDNITEDEQARYLVEVYAKGRASGVTAGMYWYQAMDQNDGYGLMVNNNNHPANWHPSGSAYSALGNFWAGCTGTTNPSGDNRTFDVPCPGGDRKIILDATAAELNAALATGATLTDLLGLVPGVAPGGDPAPLVGRHVGVIPGPPPPINVTDFIMGINAHLGQGQKPSQMTDATNGLMKDQIAVQLMGATSVRDAAYWTEIDKTDDFGTAKFNPGIQSGGKVLLILAYADAAKMGVGADGSAFPATKSQREAFLKYAIEAVNQIGVDNLSGIEIWNEWDGYFGWDDQFNQHPHFGDPCPDVTDPNDDPGCPLTYAKLVRTLIDPAWEGLTEQSLRDVAGTVPIIANATSYQDDPWTQVVMTYLKNNNVTIDGAVTHPYVGNGGTPQDAVDSVRHVSDFVALFYGKRLPIWVTEAGWGQPGGVTQRTQAEYLVELYTKTRASHLAQGLWWYQLEDDMDPPDGLMGLFAKDPDDQWRPGPWHAAGYAYAALGNFWANCTDITNPSGDNRTFDLSCTGGTRHIILGTSQTALKALSDAGATIVDLMGLLDDVAPGTAARPEFVNRYIGVIPAGPVVNPFQIDQGTSLTKTYGDGQFTLTASGGTGTGPVTWSSTLPATVAVDAATGQVTIKGATPLATIMASRGTDSATINIAVNKAALTAKADNKTRAFGAANPELTITYTGFVNGDTEADLDTAPVASTTAGPTTPVGTAEITVAGGVSANYTFAYVKGTLTITKAAQAPLTIVGGNVTKTYGDAPFTLTATGGTGAGEITWASSDANVVSINADTGEATIRAATATPVTITATKSGGTAYPDVSATATVTVAKAVLTVTADNKTRAYGQDNPALTVSYSGFVNGDTEADLTAKPVAATTATRTTPAGTADITVSGGASDNYTFKYVKGTLTITAGPGALTIDQGPSLTKTYGDGPVTLTASGGTGTGAITWSSSDTTVITIDPATGVATLNSASDVAATITATRGAETATMTIKVDKAVLTVTADDKTRAYGQANPALTVSYSGFVNGDTEADLTIAPVASTTATTTTDVGKVDITVAGGASPNYAFTYVKGTLTITKAAQAPLTIVGGNVTKTNGDAAFTLTTSGGTGTGAVAWTSNRPAAVSVEAATGVVTVHAATGANPVTITATKAGGTNLDEVFATATVTVDKATLTVTADDKTRAYGQDNPALTVSYSGFVNGDTEADLAAKPVAATTATRTTPAGTVDITVSGGASDNYAFVYKKGTLTITAAGAVAVVTVSPTSAVTGQTLTISGSGWAPGEKVAITIYSKEYDLGTVIARADGTLPPVTWVVPAEMAAGLHHIKMTGPTSGTVETTFTVREGTKAPTGGNANTTSSLLVVIGLSLMFMGVTLTTRLTRRYAHR